MSWLHSLPTEPRSTRTRITIRAPREASIAIGGLAVPSLLMRCWLVLIAVALHASLATAQVLLLPEDSGPKAFRVGALELEYADKHPDHPPLAALVPVRVELTQSEGGWTAPREGGSSEPLSIGGPDSAPILLEASGLAQVLRTLVVKLHEAGLYGVDVRPASRDIDPESERDLRSPERSTLALVIRVGRVHQIRTIAVGDRIKNDWNIDNALHARIRERSPLQPVGVADEDSTDLLDRRKLEDYLFRLNRHSGRHVEAALSPAEEPGGVVLDYRVGEAKPWYAFAQTTNTGTRRTNLWQTRLGITHRQLSNRDDILSVEYLNAGFDDVNGLNARYQAPFFGRARPDWMNRQKGDPDWIDWLPREKIPWWGVDRLRWEVEFGWGRASTGRASDVPGLANDKVRSQDFRYGGRFVYEIWQYRDFFVDLWGGLRLSSLEVDNDTNESIGEALLVIPKAGIHAERINQLSTLALDISGQGNIKHISEGDLDDLGRDATDAKYATLDWNLGYSTFLEPLLFPNAWRDPSSEQTSTLAHEISLGFRGQYAFDYRLIPQVSRTIGGLYSVRGYDQSVGVGDTVLIGSFEYRFHLPRALPVTREPMRLPLIGDFRAAPQQVYGRPDWDLVLRAFVDVGRSIRNDQSDASSGIREYNQTLVGVGLGADLTIRSNLRAQIDWATALNDTNQNIARPTEVGDNEIHVLFSILY
ncbi:MAG: hypothetical protein CL908_09405 [Deltaproteobacteria bacterium]|nr:hypothetical protein [Deltaproteobacteria bacterium]